MFANGYYAKIWQIKEIKDKYSEIRISISTKNKNTNEYEQQFGGFVRMCGQAHQQMSYLNEGDRFKIVRCGVTNHYDKEKNTTYTNYLIFEIELAEDQEKKQADLAAENPFL